jgi:translation elongation factor P/translation initiation factor 5A
MDQVPHIIPALTGIAGDIARQPTEVADSDGRRYVVMTEESYRQLGLTKLFETMDRLAAEAKANGLTEEVLEKRLANES